MEVTVKQLYKEYKLYEGQLVTIKGWVRSNRNSKFFGFLEINDGTFFSNVQVVYEEEKLGNFDSLLRCTIGSALIIKGTLELTQNAKQAFEIKATKVIIEGNADADFPLQKKRHTFEYLRTIAHLRPRTNTFSAVFRVRSLLAHAIHSFFQDNNFVYVHTPIVTGSDCEGAGEMFRVTTLDSLHPPLNDAKQVDYTKDFFGKETNLTVSGQLAVETYCMAFKNVYTFGPTFRAENSNTARHASEFWMIEPEMAFCNLKQSMKIAEKMMKYIINYVMEKAPEEMEFFNKFIEKGLFDKLRVVTSS